MAERNKAVVRRMIEEVWNGGDLAVVDELVAEDYVGHDPGYPQPIRGPEGLKQWVMAARAAFPDFRIAVEDLLAEGDRVVGRITMRGTHHGALAGLPPTGRPVEFPAIFVRRLAGGKFVEGWDIADMLGLMQQLGALPPPGQVGA